MSLESIKHAIGEALHKAASGAEEIFSFLQAHEVQIDTDTAVISGIAAEIPGLGPVASVIPAAEKGALGALIEGVQKAETDAAHTNTTDDVQVVVTLKQDAYNTYKAIASAIKVKPAA